MKCGILLDLVYLQIVIAHSSNGARENMNAAAIAIPFKHLADGRDVDFLVSE